ncbi:MAG: mandelate racemase/muconate lactonizing enzyme family protein [Rhodospirillaceae bacterium]|nr:mandelate racemase/muconate lactonizing enzyme family protein [Rhodospirillaceae bacterium]
MRIATVTATPLLVPYRQPYHWAQGVRDGADVVLVEIGTDEGIIGYGESCGAPDADAVAAVVRSVAPLLVGQPAGDIARLAALVHRAGFAGGGPGNQRRFANQVVAGIEMALWDIAGKAVGRPVHQLFGGAVRERVEHFGFLQGDDASELAADARAMVAAGHAVIYMKVGRGEAKDIENVAAVRAAIGERRLRLDANEAWDMLTARRMTAALARFAPEFIEQPTPADSIAALAQLRASVDVPLAADQCVHTPSDVYEVARARAADLIVLGLHEVGGLLAFRKAAAVAEAAGLNVCLHGVFETGITCCAANQVAATIPNLDDGNQYMIHLLAEDIVASPDLRLKDGALDVIRGPGLGFELDRDAVARAAERWRKSRAVPPA